MARPRFNSSTHHPQHPQHPQHSQQHSQQEPTQSYELFASMFRIESLLGQGGMGSVYAAHDLHLDRPVAIKVLHPRYARDGQMAARFLREGRVMASLSSVHTTRVHMVGRDESGAPYIVMERAEGSDLVAIVEERGRLPWREAVEYLRQMCVAISEAHALGIIHRDIKPANVIVGESSVDGSPLVKVLDFGVAKEERTSSQSAGGSGSSRLPPGEGSGLTSMRSVLGTPEYMSPEQFRATRDVDHRADIWSLGATLFFMIAGKPPFEGETLTELMTLIQHGEVPSVLDAFLNEKNKESIAPPPQLDAIIRRCLHRDPEGRFASVTDLSAALMSVARPSGIVPYPHDRGSDPTTMMTHYPVFRSDDNNNREDEANDQAGDEDDDITEDDGRDSTEEILPTTLVDRTVAMPYPAAAAASARPPFTTVPPPPSELSSTSDHRDHTMISSSAPVSAAAPPTHQKVPWHVVMIAVTIGVLVGGGVVAAVLLTVLRRFR